MNDFDRVVSKTPKPQSPGFDYISLEMSLKRLIVYLIFAGKRPFWKNKHEDDDDDELLYFSDPSLAWKKATFKKER